ncbi:MULTISPECIES: DEAD/DEAH box helicase family protein [Nostocales]|uniref:Type III restriction endonuclease subunit R n=1 Tax=Dolichospermum flos-aquae UHCC 0037 TaxID=2590026 RepID=A0ACC7S3J6_DOLFA|nr:MULTISPECIES: DEAD/DEAH box helicase family protein [Nostocales]MBO1066657.1 DEAD/DEAH box helicase family protein [Anabaena sp. 54]MTJ43030.1 type III restriction endonuclease subunit R [Dolichospermum flos-aquae UHCC 0037]OBQ18875.1 MAG: type III restriction endonuclease subunit R [Anabaena sp. AL93]
MNNIVNNITNRLSLRPPQRQSLEILDRVCDILPINGQSDIETSLAKINQQFPKVTDFEREFPSLCFALATGVGKTRLMGAFISYLHLAYDIKNFFVLAPNLTIYNKLITDFTPNNPKYVFTGISEFAINSPIIITGENYETNARTILDPQITCKINIFNISKINSEVRGGKTPKIKRLSEYIGESYFDYLSQLKDLVILMDESHRYRASAGQRVINQLKPLMGLELTATPSIETSKKPVYFKNVIYEYSLGTAIKNGFVKDPAVVTRKDFNPASLSPAAIEQIKLEDGIYLHENIKAELKIYALQTGKPIVKPFMLVIARDTTHATQLLEMIKSDEFAAGFYKDKVIQVDSSKTGTQEDEMVERLLKVEHPDEPTEIVIHVNMLKEGWDVTNLYTIVPLRAANSEILIKQSIGRGLRLPYGKRTGVTIVDRLNIVAHDKFQEIVEEAKRPESEIRLQQIILTPEELEQKTKTVVSQSKLDKYLGITTEETINLLETEIENLQPFIVESPIEAKITFLTRQEIQKLENQPEKVPTASYLSTPKVQAIVREAVAREYQPEQLEIEGVTTPPNIADIVAKTTDLVIQRTIDIPKIIFVPQGEVKSGFRSFALDMTGLNYRVPSKKELYIQSLATDDSTSLEIKTDNSEEFQLENYIVKNLVNFDDICYDENADLLYDLASQVISHFLTYLSEEETQKVLSDNQIEIANFVHNQMIKHFWEDDKVEYKYEISKGFTSLKESAYTTNTKHYLDYRTSPPDKSNMSKYLFTGFSKCLYTEQKFESEAERVLSIILERDAIKWFKPARGQFQIYYKWDGNYLEYQPDFVAETAEIIYMLEPKNRDEIDSPQVVAKKDVAVKWCQNASNYMLQHNGKPWVYVLIPHDAIAQNMTLKGLGDRFKKK